MKSRHGILRLSLTTAVLSLFTNVNTSAVTLHVWQESLSPGPPYADWATAAHTIQDAVDAASAGDAVLVTNGVYASRGQAVHCSHHYIEPFNQARKE